MNNNKKSLVNIIATLAIILAFSFSTNMSASSVSVVSTTNVTLATTYFTVVGGGGSSYNNRYNKCSYCSRRGCNKRCKDPKKPGGGSTPTTPTDPDSVPLDGGLGFLMLGAAALGVKKLRGKKDAKS